MIFDISLNPVPFEHVDAETISYLTEALNDVDDLEEAIDLVASMVDEISEDDVRKCLDCDNVSEKGNGDDCDAERVQEDSEQPQTTVLSRVIKINAEDDHDSDTLGTVIDNEGQKLSSSAVSFTKEECTERLQSCPSSSQQKKRHRKGKRNQSGSSQSRKPHSQSPTNTPPSTSSTSTEADGFELLISSEDSRFAQDHIGDSREVFIRGLDISFLNGMTLLVNSQLILSPPRVYGLIGRNGCGKSTLLKALATRKLKAFPEHISTLYIDQGASIDFTCVLDYVVAGNEELIRQRKREMEITTQLEEGNSNKQQSGTKIKEIGIELTKIAEQLELLGNATAEDEARHALEELGFSEEMMQANASMLSGGWRMKAALARCMFCPPQFLLLDEPNNFLDLNGVLWLQQFVKSLDDTCTVIVSHDRSFLDNITTDIIEIKNKKLNNFNGNFSAFLQNKEETFKKQMRLYENQERSRQRIQQTINQGIATARRTGNDKILGMVASRKKKLNDRLGAEKREDGKRWRTNTRRDTNSQKKYESCIDGGRVEIEKPTPPKPLKFKFPTVLSALPNKRCFSIDNVSFSYEPDKPILNNVTFSLDLGQKIGILGRNGAGKSTLINLIVDKLKPTSGKVERSRHAKVALFNQHHEEDLNLTRSALQHLKLKFGSKFKEQELRNVLGSYGIGGDKASKPMTNLSGGQKTRVSLATIAMSEPHVLIADEISNHLDFESIQALTEAINDFPGAVLVVSHDRYFMQSVATEYWEVKDKEINKLQIEYNEYTDRILNSSSECTI
eukprot:m.24729 g.24729  ORF g.24729 m.24729 type:complete len:788 (-) comp5693_c0_seq2:140-2503(-)